MNNSFGGCIADICGLELCALADTPKYTVYGNRIAVIEGNGGILDYTSDKILFLCGKQRLEICGDNLKLKYLEKHFAVIEGRIFCVAVKNG